MSISRKQFLSGLAWGSCGLTIFGNYGFISAPFSDDKTWKAIVVDFQKCAGCRTCEAVCSAYNNTELIDGKTLSGRGNPELSNIRVWRYHPPADVPVTCFLCADAPCVGACPVNPHIETGRKALYRDAKFGTIVNDLSRCIGCQACAETCRKTRGGVIFPDNEGSPKGMCTLCNGDPSCVKWCPYEALFFLEITPDMPMRSMTPNQIATILFEKFYDAETKKTNAL